MQNLQDDAAVMELHGVRVGGARIVGGVCASGSYAGDVRMEAEPDSSSGTAVLERPEVEERTEMSDNGDADRFAHYVSRDRIAESRLTGRPVVALCGKVWVPKHDPSQFPVCPDCKRIYEEMMR